MRASISVAADRASSVQLPGDERRWPLDVRVSGRALPVRRSAGAPWVDLPAGAHRIEGRFAWSAAPDDYRLARDRAHRYERPRVR